MMETITAVLKKVGKHYRLIHIGQPPNKEQYYTTLLIKPEFNFFNLTSNLNMVITVTGESYFRSLYIETIEKNINEQIYYGFLDEKNLFIRLFVENNKEVLFILFNNVIVDPKIYKKFIDKNVIVTGICLEPKKLIVSNVVLNKNKQKYKDSFVF